MRIENNGYFGLGQLSQTLNAQDPFELDLKVTQLNTARQDTAPITSHSLCTPTCGNTGTGNSFCCNR